MKQACKQKQVGNKKYFCYFELALRVIGGKWKSNILYHLGCEEVLRFGALKKIIPSITEKMLIQQLKELQTDKLVTRKAYGEIPPKVEYRLTELGMRILPVLKQLRNWGILYEQSLGLASQYGGDDYEQIKDEPIF